MREAEKTMRLMSETSDREIERIIDLMRRDESFDAPTDAVRWSKNLFRARAAEPKKSVVEKVLAILQMDLAPNRAAFGERSASASSARQMLFQAGENALDIRIAEARQGFNLRGQILGAGFADCKINLGKFEATANELGEFKLANIPSGIYNLNVQISGKEIVVEDLELQ